MEQKNEELSLKEEGEISDDGENIEDVDLKVIDEWIADAQPADDIRKTSRSLPKTYYDDSNKYKSKDERRDRDKQEKRRLKSRSGRHDYNERDRHERRHSPSTHYRRPESRFWERHRATTPRIQNTHSRHTVRPLLSCNKENDLSNLGRQNRDVAPKLLSQAAVPSLLDLAIAPPPPPPPPLPTAPPPDQAEPPPPPPPLFAPRKKRTANISPADKRARGILYKLW